MKYRIDFTKEELEQLAFHIDMSVKATGLQAVKSAAALLALLENGEEVDPPKDE